MLNFDVTREERELIARAAARGYDMFQKVASGRPSFSLMDLEMDITAAHCNGSRLDLGKLLAFDDLNFSHDIGGIVRHIDRQTGELRDCFVPRSAAPQEALTYADRTGR